MVSYFILCSRSSHTQSSVLFLHQNFCKLRHISPRYVPLGFLDQVNPSSMLTPFSVCRPQPWPLPFPLSGFYPSNSLQTALKVRVGGLGKSATKRHKTPSTASSHVFILILICLSSLFLSYHFCAPSLVSRENKYSRPKCQQQGCLGGSVG